MSDTKDKMTLNEGALQAIKGNYNEALVLQYIYEWTGNGVKIASKYLKEKAKIDNIVRDWDNQLRNKISNWRDAKKIIVQGSLDMTKYLVGQNPQTYWDLLNCATFLVTHHMKRNYETTHQLEHSIYPRISKWANNVARA